MSGQSAKRLGLEVEGDLELELRLRRIELSLDKKVDANQDSEQTGRGKGAVPQVTGLRVIGQTPGSATIGWNAVSISDLRRYELAFSTAFAFNENLQEFNEASTQFVFNTASDTGGGGGATWFARVRAVNSSGQRGVWSVTLNLTTGQAQTEDLAEGSVTSEIISSTDAVAASQVSFVNTTSNMTATQVQAALDELAGAGFSDRYDSGQTALPTQDSFTDFTHGLGRVPRSIVMFLECTTADLDYSAGDVFYIGAGYTLAADDAGNENDWSILRISYISSTVIRVGYATRNQASLTLLLKDGTNVSTITDGSWRIRVTAYA